MNFDIKQISEPFSPLNCHHAHLSCRSMTTHESPKYPTRRKKIRCAAICGTFFVLTVLVPQLYTLHLDLPRPWDIHVSQGAAEFKGHGKFGNGPGALIIEGHSYTCSSPSLFATPDCFPYPTLKQLREELGGKTLTVTWFYQPAHLFYRNRRVLKIEQEGKIWVTPEAVIQSMKQDRENEPTYILISCVVTCLVLLLFFWVIDREAERDRRIAESAGSS
jgi:hypothetical protein